VAEGDATGWMYILLRHLLFNPNMAVVQLLRDSGKYFFAFSVHRLNRLLVVGRTKSYPCGVCLYLNLIRPPVDFFFLMQAMFDVGNHRSFFQIILT
jgi:hypothetical protein